MVNSYISRKFEEIYPPEVSEFVYITDDTYTVKQVPAFTHIATKSFPLLLPFIRNKKLKTLYYLSHSLNPMKSIFWMDD